MLPWPPLFRAARAMASAVLSYGAALALALPQPVWAPVSALVVAQDRLPDTLRSFRGRLIGTALGVAIAMAVHLLLHPLGAPPLLVLGVATGLASLLASVWPAWRVCLWTAAITLLGHPPEMSILASGLARFLEVTLGACIATAIAALEFRSLVALGRSPSREKGGDAPGG
ncbi:FUSC family protein [Roseomonas mucosa]